MHIHVQRKRWSQSSNVFKYCLQRHFSRGTVPSLEASSFQRNGCTGVSDELENFVRRGKKSKGGAKSSTELIARATASSIEDTAREFVDGDLARVPSIAHALKLLVAPPPPRWAAPETEFTLQPWQEQFIDTLNTMSVARRILSVVGAPGSRKTTCSHYFLRCSGRRCLELWRQ